jgi:uncharacterized membrane protein
MTRIFLRQWWLDLRSRFWLRPAAMTVASVALGVGLVASDEVVELPQGLAAWVYAGGVAGARDVLGVVAAATIGVAGTTFSITVAALSLASNQMGPRLLRNFTRDAGNQYALGAFVATFAYALVVLRSVHEEENGAFVPQLAVSVALLLAGVCIGVLVWFLHHVASSINLDRVVALVQRDLAGAIAGLPRRGERAAQGGERLPAGGPGGALRARASGYLRVLDEAALVAWAAREDALLELAVRPGGFLFAGATIGTVRPARLAEAAETELAAAMALGMTRNVEQDLEYSVRQMVEVGVRALSSGHQDPFTAITVIDQLGAALCDLAGRELPDGTGRCEGVLRLRRPSTDYRGLVDAMFHMLRQEGAGQPAVAIRLVEVLGAVAEVETDPARRAVLLDHLDLAARAGREATDDPTVLATLARRRAEGPR